MPLSKRLESSRSSTARSTFAVASTKTAPLPAPTPSEGLPDLSAALTIPGPPVARIEAIPWFWISAVVL